MPFCNKQLGKTNVDSISKKKKRRKDSKGKYSHASEKKEDFYTKTTPCIYWHRRPAIKANEIIQIAKAFEKKSITHRSS